LKLIVDANILLSAVIGGQAAKILLHPKIEALFTTESVLDEVRQYAPVLARRRRLPVDLVLLAAATLPVRTIPVIDYSNFLPEAQRRIGQRDPDDAFLLALALFLEIPIWSNDKDFQISGMQTITTSLLLMELTKLQQK
jgi:predicted nucleic acid-binding protein